MTNHLFYKAVFTGFLTLSLAFNLVTVNASPALSGTGPAQSLAVATPEPVDKSAAIEISFLESMIDHHMMAIEMAEMVPERATHADLILMATEIIETQSAEIELMQHWLKEWYGITYTPPANQERHGMDLLSSMKGPDFEKQFIMMMVAHHGEAVKMAVIAIEYGFHPELVELANEIILTQTAEINEMRRMLREWYCITKITPQAEDIMRMHQMMDDVMNGEMHHMTNEGMNGGIQGRYLH